MISDFKRFLRLIFVIYPLVYLSKFALKAIMFTCSVEIHGLDMFKKVGKEGKCILMLWHNRLTLIPIILRKYAPNFIYRAVISNSQDGELLAVLAKSYSAGRILRVPHNARHHALNQMINLLKNENEIMIVTPDGPRGPAYEVKPGIVVAARETNAKIVPIAWSSSKFWELNTWDKLVLPKPFSRISITLGEPLSLPKDSNRSLSEETSLLQSALSKLTTY